MATPCPDEQKAWKSHAPATTHSTTSSDAPFDTSSKTAGRQVDRARESEKKARGSRQLSRHRPGIRFAFSA